MPKEGKEFKEFRSAGVQEAAIDHTRLSLR
jgi:hypothetical protein